jgi:hypothetical protein
MPSNLLTGLPVRVLRTKTVNNFNGMNNWILKTVLDPGTAEECLNVVPASSGGLEKMRLPTMLYPKPTGVITAGVIGAFTVVTGRAPISFHPYKVGDLLGVVDKTGSGAVIQVTAVTFGQVSAAVLVSGGLNYGLNTDATVAITGTGTGCRIIITALTQTIAPVQIKSGPQRFYDFQQAIGVRQTIAQFGSQLWNLLLVDPFAQLIDDNPANALPYSMIGVNNILYLANGTRMYKWLGLVGPTGAPLPNSFCPWGGNAPAAAPSIVGGSTYPILTIERETVAPPNVFCNFSDPSESANPTPGTTVATITGVSDNSLNGNFVVVSFPSPGNVAWTQLGPNSNQIDAGFISFLGPGASNPLLPAGLVSRKSGVATYPLDPGQNYGVGGFLAPIAGNTLLLAGAADATFNGTLLINTVTLTGLHPNFTVLQPGLPDTTTPAGPVTFAPTLAPQFGYEWSYAYYNSVTGHSTNIGPPTVQFGGGSPAGTVFVLTAVPPTDPQFDSIAWFRTVDGGGDQFLWGIVPIGSGGLSIQDVKLDTELNQQILGPLVNNPPLPGFYLSVFQDRVYVFRLAEAAQDVIYSGVEQIFFGNPPECYPPNNRLRLAAGANEIAGGGVIQAGVIAFSRDNRMFMQRGVVEDVTTNAPILFSSTLEELPFALGTFSHESIRSTPAGLIWYCSDNTIRLFDGTDAPLDVSTTIYPILRSVTPGQQGLAVGCYYTFEERNWYILLLPVNGSLTLNKIIIVDLNPNAAANRGVFPCDTQADFCGIIEDGLGNRQLCIAQNGNILKLQGVSDTTSGVSLTPTQTAGNMRAFWRGGAFGNDSPDQQSLNRYGNLICDCDGFNVVVNVYSDKLDEVWTVRRANIGASKPRISINRKGKRCQYEINFPDQDQSANVLSLTHFSVPIGQI